VWINQLDSNDTTLSVFIEVLQCVVDYVPTSTLPHTVTKV